MKTHVAQKHGTRTECGRPITARVQTAPAKTATCQRCQAGLTRWRPAR